MKITDTGQRLFSLDALRGFDMFWIIGADAVLRKIANTTEAPFFQVLAKQVSHVSWNGFHMYDLIFPLFLFLAGVATAYSIGKQMENGKNRQKILYKVIKRGFVLVFLGIIFNNGLKLMPLSEMRFVSVLGRIGLAYMFANIIYLYAKQRSQYIWFGALLIGYWLLLMFTSAPGFPMGDLTMEGNFVSYFDRLFLPGKLRKVIHDPQGILATVPAISTALLGIFTGTLLKKTTIEKRKHTALKIIGIGFGCIILAQIWNLVFPINRHLWTSSFVLHCGGISMLLMALFYYIIDIMGYKKWAFFFKVIGMNSILIYLSTRFIDWSYTTNAFFQWLGQLVGDPYNVVILAICLVFVKWVFLYFLYKQKVFLRV